MITILYVKKRANNKTGVREQITVVLVTLIAAIAVMVLGAPDKWLTAIFVTVVTFGGMISFFKGRWRYRQFWMIIAGALFVHLVLTWWVFAIVLRQRNDVGFLVCVPFIFLECFLLYHAVRFLEGKLAE